MFEISLTHAGVNNIKLKYQPMINIFDYGYQV